MRHHRATLLSQLCTMVESDKVVCRLSLVLDAMVFLPLVGECVHSTSLELLDVVFHQSDCAIRPYARSRTRKNNWEAGLKHCPTRIAPAHCTWKSE